MDLDLDLELEQLDVKTTFLHGDLEETIYMELPEGYFPTNVKNKACLLKRLLYGLRQSPRQWFKKFDEFMMRTNFKWSLCDSCVYLKDEKDHKKT